MITFASIVRDIAAGFASMGGAGSKNVPSPAAGLASNRRDGLDIAAAQAPAPSAIGAAGLRAPARDPRLPLPALADEFQYLAGGIDGAATPTMVIPRLGVSRHILAESHGVTVTLLANTRAEVTAERGTLGINTMYSRSGYRGPRSLPLDTKPAEHTVELTRTWALVFSWAPGLRARLTNLDTGSRETLDAPALLANLASGRWKLDVTGYDGVSRSLEWTMPRVAEERFSQAIADRDVGSAVLFDSENTPYRRVLTATDFRETIWRSCVAGCWTVTYRMEPGMGVGIECPADAKSTTSSRWRGNVKVHDDSTVRDAALAAVGSC